MDQDRFRTNFEAYTDAMLAIKRVSTVGDLDIPRIVVCSPDSCALALVIRELIGFHSRLYKTSNIVEYRLRHDPERLEPVARINNAPVNYDAMSKTSVLFDEIQELGDWEMEPEGDMIVITIRSHNVPDIDIVEVPWTHSLAGNYWTDAPNTIYVSVADVNGEEGLRIDAPLVCFNKINPNHIQRIHLYLKQLIDWRKLNEARRLLKRRSAELGIPLVTIIESVSCFLGILLSCSRRLWKLNWMNTMQM